jgi:hypothetical protein
MGLQLDWLLPLHVRSDFLEICPPPPRSIAPPSARPNIYNAFDIKSIISLVSPLKMIFWYAQFQA